MVLINNRQTIADIVQRCLQEAYIAGRIPWCNQEWITVMGQVYDFALEDIVGILIHKRGVGDGIWFLLKSGEIRDRFGQWEKDATILDFE